MQPDRQAWLDAGGDDALLQVLDSIGETAPFARGGERVLAAIHPDRPQIGTLSGWTGGPEVLREGERWLAARGCTVAEGPMAMCAWFPHRAVVDPTDDAPFTTEPRALSAPWREAGYHPVAHGSTAVVEHDPIINAATDRMAALSTRGWSVTPLPLDLGEGRASEASFREAVGVLHAISARAAEKLPGYAPIPVDALQRHLAPMRKVVDPRLVFIARGPDRAPAGVLFAVPDHEDPGRGWFVVTHLAVLPAHQQTGIGAWLVAAAHRAARKAGYQAGVHWLTEPTTRAWDLGRHGGRPLRRYALLHKALHP